MMGRALRLTAIVIALAGLADPALTREMPTAPPLTIALLAPEGLAAAERLRADLEESYDVAVRMHAIDSPASACPATGGCIVVSPGAAPARLTAGADVIGAVDTRAGQERYVTITNVEAPSRVSVHGASWLNVRLRRGVLTMGGVRGGAEAGVRAGVPATSSVRGGLEARVEATGVRGVSLVHVFDDGVLVGAGTHEWSAADTEADVRIEWVPIAVGPRRLRVTLITEGGASGTPPSTGGTKVPPSTSGTPQVPLPPTGGTKVPPSVNDAPQGPRPPTGGTEVPPSVNGPPGLEHDTADVGVDVRGETIPILMYEPEATWLGTFVRRALEADPRFTLHTRTRLAPSLAVSRGADRPLTRGALESTGTVIVSAPGSLVASEVELLERFVRVRGGSVVLLLDRPPSGPVSRLLPPTSSERREAEPRAVGLLRASEWITFDQTAPGVTALDSTDGRAVVVARAMGRGRVVASGAMDAWRYRDGSFTRFWSSLVADAAAAAGSSLQVALASSLVAAGDPTRLDVEWRSQSEIPEDITARAELVCEGRETVPVRLWPGARPGSFRGTFASQAEGVCQVRASIIDPIQLTASAGLLVTSGSRVLPAHPRRLEGAVVAHGGLVVQAGDESVLVSRVHERIAVRREQQETHPMRSPWWIVPFAACLGGEWWLRRRRGLR